MPVLSKNAIRSCRYVLQRDRGRTLFKTGQIEMMYKATTQNRSKFDSCFSID